ncbi:MAG: DNA polymerase IV [Candidatus Omnitrophica bacterium]|nr:DNA polymerase IV [Candidatus Omnitrophota bacterium]
MSGNTNNSGDFLRFDSYPKAIAHIDGDAFFASCEEARDPSLRGKPVVTGKERGIIACANYAAKALGIRRGVSLRDARTLCPGLVILPSDYETYSIYSERMFAIIRRFTPSVEEFSIDEAFCDLTGLRRLYRTSYEEIARRIKETIQRELDISVSVGLSLTKTLAKICSRHRKPDAFTALPGRDLSVFLKGVELERVCGFGPNTVNLLAKCGMHNVLDFTQRPIGFADKLLGKTGRELWHELRGTAVYTVSTKKKDTYLSISKTKTFSPPASGRDIVKAQLTRNLEAAFIKLRRHTLSAKTLTVYLRTKDYTGFGRVGELTRHSSSTLDFTKLCAALFNAAFREGLYYRATGVIVSDLVTEGIDSHTLFDDPVEIAKISGLSRAVDAANKIYGKYTVHLASTGAALVYQKGHPRNAAAWRKSALLKGETERRRLNIPLLKL